MCVLISKQYLSDIFVYFLLISKAANFRKIPAKEAEVSFKHTHCDPHDIFFNLYIRRHLLTK